MKKFFFLLVLLSTLLIPIKRVHAEPQLELTLIASPFHDERREALEVGANTAFRLLESMDGAFDDVDVIFRGYLVMTRNPHGNERLGVGGPGHFRGGFEGAPLENACYPIFMAKLLAGNDLHWDEYDYSAEIFAGDIPWNYNLNGVGQNGQYCCVEAACHEAGHGQGFGFTVAHMDEDGNGFLLTEWGGYTIWDHFLEDEDGVRLLEYDEGSQE